MERRTQSQYVADHPIQTIFAIHQHTQQCKLKHMRRGLGILGGTKVPYNMVLTTYSSYSGLASTDSRTGSLTAPQRGRTAPSSLCVKRNMPTHHDAFNRVQLALQYSCTTVYEDPSQRTASFSAERDEQRDNISQLIQFKPPSHYCTPTQDGCAKNQTVILTCTQY